MPSLSQSERKRQIMFSQESHVLKSIYCPRFDPAPGKNRMIFCRHFSMASHGIPVSPKGLLRREGVFVCRPETCPESGFLTPIFLNFQFIFESQLGHLVYMIGISCGCRALCFTIAASIEMQKLCAGGRIKKCTPKLPSIIDNL